MAKSNTSNISIRMDSDLKAAAEALYEEGGKEQCLKSSATAMTSSSSSM